MNTSYFLENLSSLFDRFTACNFWCYSNAYLQSVVSLRQIIYSPDKICMYYKENSIKSPIEVNIVFQKLKLKIPKCYFPLFNIYVQECIVCVFLFPRYFRYNVTVDCFKKQFAVLIVQLHIQHNL